MGIASAIVLPILTEKKLCGVQAMLLGSFNILSFFLSHLFDLKLYCHFFMFVSL